MAGTVVVVAGSTEVGTVAGTVVAGKTTVGLTVAGAGGIFAD